MAVSTTIFAVVVVLLIAIAAVGFYEYYATSSNYNSLLTKVSQLQSNISTLNSNYKALLSNYQSLYSNYTSLSAAYSTLMAYLKGNVTELQKLTSELKTTSTLASGGAIAPVMLFYDGVAIESPQDVLPFLANNFTAVVQGEPFPGNYSLSTFNSTWLKDFFTEFETVYFYTTALPTVEQVNNNTFVVSAVAQYFVAPTNDPYYLRVINASTTFYVQLINGSYKITKLVWKGNYVPLSAVIAGYPSIHEVAANQALEAYLWQINAMAAEFPGNVTANYFSPGAVLTVEGSLPPGLKAGNYSGIKAVESFFNQWDNYFIFALTYSQSLTPSGVAVPPVTAVQLNLNNGTAVVKANDTVFLGFVNQGQPGFPAIYDMHVNVIAYLTYNSTSASWQITREVMNFTEVNSLSDTIYYPISPPTFLVNGEQTVNVSAAKGAVLQVGNIIVILPPGTYAKNLATNQTLAVYNFSLITFSNLGVFSPPNTTLTPLYTFAFAINGHIAPTWELVDSNGKPRPAITIIMGAPTTWTSWTWFGGTFNGTAYVGGSYKFADKWIYGNGFMVNLDFIKPVLWVILSSQTPLSQGPQLSTVKLGNAYGLSPISAGTIEVDSQQGAAFMYGNILVVIPPGDNVSTTVGVLNNYNFSIVLYDPLNVSSAPSGAQPFEVFAYAVNGVVSFNVNFSKPLITVMLAPDNNAQMWTWGPVSGGYGYKFQDPILTAPGLVINLTFKKPVPWVLAYPFLNAAISTQSTSTTVYSATLTF
ncbi:MAG: hypothetical protein L7H02_00275 [Sulfolobales archaeon]|nr:hypothetical protein [Sulfolobales archaeon]MCG2893165.1 hypothetical protein [Sulfolobales archaeon]